MILTPADRKVWAVLSKVSRPFTTRELASLCGYRSHGTVWAHLDRLTRAGIIKCEGNRAWKVLQPFNWVEL